MQRKGSNFGRRSKVCLKPSHCSYKQDTVGLKTHGVESKEKHANIVHSPDTHTVNTSVLDWNAVQLLCEENDHSQCFME